MSLVEWMARQRCVFLRYFRRHRRDATPEQVLDIATRYAEKHAAERLPRAA